MWQSFYSNCRKLVVHCLIHLASTHNSLNLDTRRQHKPRLNSYNIDRLVSICLPFAVSISQRCFIKICQRLPLLNQSSQNCDRVFIRSRKMLSLAPGRKFGLKKKIKRAQKKNNFFRVMWPRYTLIIQDFFWWAIRNCLLTQRLHVRHHS